MNFTAHLHCSPDHALVSVYNFSGDGFKGNQWREQAHAAQLLGVDLHRHIDHFTDQHPLVKAAITDHLRPLAGRYAAVAWDLLSDYFLQNHWNSLNALQPHTASQSLPSYLEQCEQRLTQHFERLSGRPALMLPSLLMGPGLARYGTLEGLQGAARGIAQRHPGGSALLHAFDNDDRLMPLLPAFLEFYPQLMHSCQIFVQEHEQSTELGLKDIA